MGHRVFRRGLELLNSALKQKLGNSKIDLTYFRLVREEAMHYVHLTGMLSSMRTEAIGVGVAVSRCIWKITASLSSCCSIKIISLKQIHQPP